MEIRTDEEDREQRILVQETAHYPFSVASSGPLPSAGDFRVACDDPRFTPDWCVIVAPTRTRESPARYSLQVRPSPADPSAYGRYELRLHIEPPPGVDPAPDQLLVLDVKPCLRSTSRPSLHLDRSGTLSLSMTLVNCSHADLSVSVDLKHHGSSLEHGWSFDLAADAGPFDLTLDANDLTGLLARSNKFGLTISASGVPVYQTTLSLKPPGRGLRSRVLAGAGAVIGLTALTVAAATASSHHSTHTSTGTSTSTSSTTATSSTTRPATAQIRLPSRIDCGSVTVGKVAACHPIQISSTGDGPLRIEGLGPPAGFVVGIGTCDHTLQPGTSCELSATFSPVGPGLTSGQLTIHQNLPGPPSYVQLTGTGVAAVTIDAPSAQPQQVGVLVTFAPPTGEPASAIVTSYTVQATDLTNPANGGETTTGTTSPLTVTNLTGNDTYTFTVTAYLSNRTSVTSGPSTPVRAPLVAQ
jgi:hypothetical protein